MRILAVTNLYPTPHTPTAGTFVEQQIVGLRTLGIEVDVLHLDRVRSGKSVYRNLGSQIKARVIATAPDLLHVMYGGVMAERATRVRSGIPSVVSFCGSDLLGQQLAGPARRMAASIGVVCSWVAARRADSIVVKSRNLENGLPKFISRAKVHVIPNGIDLERFRPMDREECRQSLGWTERTFQVLFPANAGGDPRKRPELAKAAVELLNVRGIPAQLRPLVGVPHEQVPVWINACDAVILTSLHEGSPNIIKETLACNVPVVSVDVGDVRERIENVSGCHVATATPEDLGDKLASVAESSRRIEGRVAVEELSLARIAGRLKSLYEETLAQRA